MPPVRVFTRTVLLLTLPLLLLPHLPAAAGPATSRPAAAAGGGVVTYQTTQRTLPSGRTYLLHAPTGPVDPQPLVIALHGALHTPEQMQTNTGLTPFSEGKFTLAYGAGINGSWNAGTPEPQPQSCCGAASAGNVDDVSYIRDVITHAKSVTPVDPDRVYLTGWSAGGMMAFKAGCQLADQVAAIVVVSGSLLVPCPAGIDTLHIHGAGDTTVPQSGTGYEGTVFLSVWTEPLRMSRGALWSLLAWNCTTGCHAWPGWVNAHLWAFLAPLTLQT